jgi:hypothetical protein
MLSAAVAFAAVLAVATACGPTANALRPTLPPRTLSPINATPQPQVTPVGIGSSIAPAASGTPPPPGIAQPMTNFVQGNAYEVTSVAVTPTGFVAVGFAGTGQGYFGLRQGVVWTSSDGLTWQQTEDPAFIDVSPTSVVSLGNDVYVFGAYSTCADALDEECTDDPNAGTVIFRSSSGGPWEQLAQTSDIVGAEFDGVRVWDTTLVAWGAAGDDNGTTTLWTSKDGLSWTPTTNLAGLDPIDSVGVGGPGIVAFGEHFDDTIEDTQLVGASSSDGIQFSSATVPQVTAASVTDVIAGPGGMAGVGWATSDTSPSVSLSVFSSDGTTWSQSTASDGSFDNTLLDDVHSTASEYVAVGSSVSDVDMTLQTGGVWVSQDGRTWRTLGAFGGLFSQYGDSALGPSGLVIFTADEQDSNEDGTDVNSTIYGWFIPTSQLAP